MHRFNLLSFSRLCQHLVVRRGLHCSSLKSGECSDGHLAKLYKHGELHKNPQEHQRKGDAV